MVRDGVLVELPLYYIETRIVKNNQQEASRLLLLLDYCLGLSHHRQVTSTTWIKAPKCVYTIKNNKNRNHCVCLGCQTL